MSIIDEALKNVEQTRNAYESERTGSSGSSTGVDGWFTRSSRNVLLVLFGVIVLAAVLGYGWWSRDRLFGGPSTGAVVMLTGDQSPPANPPSENSTVAAVENGGAVIASAGPEQNISLPTTPADDAGEDVAGLTLTGEERYGSTDRADKLDLAKLTAEEKGQSRVSQAASGTRDLTDPSTAKDEVSSDKNTQKNQQLLALTPGELVDVGAIDPDLVELTAMQPASGVAKKRDEETVAALTAETNVVKDASDASDSVGLDVAELTAMPVSAAKENNVGRSADESVAALTDADAEAARMAEISASPAVGADDRVNELTAITAAAQLDAVGPAETGQFERVNTNKSGEVDLDGPVVTKEPTEQVNAKTTAKRQSGLSLQQVKLEEALGNHQRALQMLVQGYPEGSKLNDDVRRLMARLEARTGNNTRAIELYSQLNPGLLSAEDRFWFGYAYFNVEQWRQAADWFALSSEADEGNVLVTLYQGMALQELGDFQGSIDAFHKAREIRPNMPEVAFNTGISWWALGQRARAVGAFRHFMRVTDGQREQFASQRRRVMQRYLTE